MSTNLIRIETKILNPSRLEQELLTAGLPRVSVSAMGYTAEAPDTNRKWILLTERRVITWRGTEPIRWAEIGEIHFWTENALTRAQIDTLDAVLAVHDWQQLSRSQIDSDDDMQNRRLLETVRDSGADLTQDDLKKLLALFLRRLKTPRL